MKVIIVSLFILIYYSQILSQNKASIILLDSIEIQPIPFGTIVIKNGSKGYYTNEKGISDQIKIGDTITISSIGYDSKTLIIEQPVQKVYLNPKIYYINVITIKPHKEKSKLMGYFRNSVKKDLVIGFKSGTELAVKIPNTAHVTGIINKIYLFVSFNYLQAKHYKNFTSIFKINIYSIDGDNVGDLLNAKQLIFNSNILKNKTIIDISQYNIAMPEDGAFVAIEWVGIVNEQTKQIEPIYTQIDPSIGLTTQPKGCIVYKRDVLRENKWKRYTSEDTYLKSIGLPNYIPRISVEVSY
jgi:hypothetical protein